MNDHTERERERLVHRVGSNKLHKEVYHSEHYKKWVASRTKNYKEYREMWRQACEKSEDYGYPLYIVIETSAICNLKCPMCPLILQHKNAGKHSKFFPYDLFCRIVDEASEIGVRSLSLNGLGEALMNPRFVDMARYAKQKGILDVMVTTNGTLLTEKMAEDIIEAGVDSVAFSFDSPDKEIYEEIRIGAVFEDVISNMKKFYETRKKIGSVNPITRLNIIDFPEYRQPLPKILSMFEDIIDIIVYVTLLDESKDWSYLKNHKDKIHFACYQASTRIFINVDGNVAPCCYDFDNNCIKLENIKNTTLKKTWNNPKAKAFRKLHQDYRWYDNKQCSQCCIPAYATGFAQND